MGAKIIRHPKSRRVVDPAAARARAQARARRGYAGDNSESTLTVETDGKTIVKEKKTGFPWFTVLLTGAVTAVGTVVVTKLADTVLKRNEPELSPTQKRMQDARDLLMMAAPSAQAPVVAPSGPSRAEMELRERVAMLEGYLAQLAQQQNSAPTAQEQMSSWLDAAEEDDDED